MIYISSACLRGRHIGNIIKQFHEKGFRNIELSGGTEYYDEIGTDLERYKQKYNIRYACHAYFPPPKEHFVVNLASCDDKIYNLSIEHYLDCIQLMRKIDCHVLSVHAGFYIEVTPDQIGEALNNEIIYNHAKSMDRFCSAYRKIEMECRKYQIEMYLENNVLNPDNYAKFGYTNQLMMTDYQSYQEMLSQIDFNLLLDIGHLYVSSRTLDNDFKTECQKFSPDCKWLHVSDNNGLYDQHKPFIANSVIFQAYVNYFNKEIPITLEINGTLEEISYNYRMVNEIKEFCEKS